MRQSIVTFKTVVSLGFLMIIGNCSSYRILKMDVSIIDQKKVFGKSTLDKDSCDLSSITLKILFSAKKDKEYIINLEAFTPNRSYENELEFSRINSLSLTKIMNGLDYPLVLIENEKGEYRRYGDLNSRFSDCPKFFDENTP
jgi:hypothetical protein